MVEVEVEVVVATTTVSDAIVTPFTFEDDGSPVSSLLSSQPPLSSGKRLSLVIVKF